MLLLEASDFFFKGLQRKLTGRSYSSGGGRTSGLGRCPGMAKIASSGCSTVKGLLYYSLLLADAGEVTQTYPQCWGMPKYEI